jgi:hypothetical protein
MPRKKNIHDHFRDECNHRLSFNGYWEMFVEYRQKTDMDGTTIYGKPVIRQANTATVQRKN